MRKTPRYPSMRTVEIKFRWEPTTLDNDVIVAVHEDNQDDQHFTPAEAERLARGLLKAASCCRGKIAWSRRARTAQGKGRGARADLPENARTVRRGKRGRL